MSALSLLAVVTAVNDAAMLVSALTPLVQRAVAAGETEVSAEALSAASAALGMDIDALDAAIVRAQARDAGQADLLAGRPKG